MGVEVNDKSGHFKQIFARHYQPKQIRLIINEERTKLTGLALLIRQVGSAGFLAPTGQVEDMPVWLVENMLTGEEEHLGIRRLGKQINAMEAIAWATKFQ